MAPSIDLSSIPTISETNVNKPDTPCDQGQGHMLKYFFISQYHHHGNQCLVTKKMSIFNQIFCLWGMFQ